MSPEIKFSWQFLKNVANALDSYRVRVLIDAKQEIIDAGVYSDDQYYNMLFNIIDEEKLKYALLEFLLKHQNNNFETLKAFTQIQSINIKKTLSLLELLKIEKAITVKEIYDEIKGDENTPNKYIFYDFSIKKINTKVVDLKSIYEPVKVIFDAKICSGCGQCAGICPVNCIGIYNGFGKIDLDKCIHCGLCYFYCPRSYLPVKILNMAQNDTLEIQDYGIIGYFKEVHSARTKIKEISEVCQDGGVSSTALYYLFDKNKIDLALGAKMSNTIWRPEPLLLKRKEDVLLAAGTKYVNNPTLSLLNELNGESKEIAVVGVPCMMQALLKSELYNAGIPSLNKIKYKIGIFCMESFSYESLLKICDILKADIKNVKKMDINKGKFSVHTKDHQDATVPIKDISNLAREDCEVCYDLTSESADISIGSIGSPPGWNTVIVRTSKGKELFDSLITHGYIESKPIAEVKPGLSMLQKVADSKKSKCNKYITAKKNENIRFPNYS
jgi:coenzyme F420 hydrogenase subunit beta